MELKVELIAWHSPGKRRVVALLNDPTGKIFNASLKYHKLREIELKKIKSSFDYWLNGHPNTSIHHGFDKTQHGGKYVDCHVFKAKLLRLYGFKCHPFADKSREACVIVCCWTSKTVFAQDTSYLDCTLKAKRSPDVDAAVKEWVKGIDPDRQ